MLVGIGQGGAARRFGDTQMDQSSQAARQTVADLAQGVGASELTEQHGNELRPAGKALGITLGGVLFHQRGEFRPWEVLEQLIEQACDLYDWIALLWAACGEAPPRNGSPTSIIGGHSFLFQSARTCFGQEWNKILMPGETVFVAPDICPNATPPVP